MARYGAVKITGKSGASYKFIAYSLDTIFRRRRAAVYVVTRRRQARLSQAFKHRKIGIDQTTDLRHMLTEYAHMKLVCGANCICVYDETDQQTRVDIQKDLWNRFGASHKVN